MEGKKMHVTELRDILAPLSPVEFFADYFRRTFGYVPGWPTKFADLMPWPALNDILRHYRLGPPQLRLIKEGAEVPQAVYCRSEQNRLMSVARISVPEFTTQLREGATLLIDNIDQLYEPLTTLAERLERLFYVCVGINMYAAWRVSRGFNVHWDDHDVLILQVAGRKEWTIYGETNKYPVAPTPETEANKPADPLWKGIVEAGDLLYIPRGWWHIALPLDEPTIHLTVGLNQVTGLTLLHWLTDKLAAEECMRMDLPLLSDANTQAKYLASVYKTVSEAVGNPELLEEFRWDMNMRAEPRQALSLPWSAMPTLIPDSDECIISCVAPRPLVVNHMKEEKVITLGYRGRIFTFNEEAAPVIEWLANSGPVSAGEAYQRFGDTFEREQLAVLVAGLVQHGVLVVRDAHSGQAADIMAGAAR